MHAGRHHDFAALAPPPRYHDAGRILSKEADGAKRDLLRFTVDDPDRRPVPRRRQGGCWQLYAARYLHMRLAGHPRATPASGLPCRKAGTDIPIGVPGRGQKAPSLAMLFDVLKATADGINQSRHRIRLLHPAERLGGFRSKPHLAVAMCRCKDAPDT